MPEQNRFSTSAKLSLRDGLLVRSAVIEALKQSIEENRPWPSEDEVALLWIANRTVDHLNKSLKSLFPDDPSVK
jgi:hypothetical protein